MEIKECLENRFAVDKFNFKKDSVLFTFEGTLSDEEIADLQKKASKFFKRGIVVSGCKATIISNNKRKVRFIWGLTIYKVEIQDNSDKTGFWVSILNEERNQRFVLKQIRLSKQDCILGYDEIVKKEEIERAQSIINFMGRWRMDIEEIKSTIAASREFAYHADKMVGADLCFENMTQSMEKLINENKEIKKLLNGMEFSSYLSSRGEYGCPCCESTSYEGHDADCKLAKFINLDIPD